MNNINKTSKSQNLISKNILVCGYYGYLNSGDDAILHSICADILKINYPTSITVLSNQPKLTMNDYPVKSVYRFSLSSVIKEIKNCDILVMGGGSLIQDVTSNKSLYYYLGILYFAKLFKKKIMLYGNGIGPINHFFNKPITSFILNKTDIITLREHLSKDLLQKLHVKKPFIEVTADPVFNLNLPSTIYTKDIYINEGIPYKKPFVGVLFRSWDKEENYIRRMAKVCDNIIDVYNYNIVFIPMKYPTDLLVSKELMKKMKHKSYIISNKHQEEKLIGFMGDARLLLSMRLHGLIYGALREVPIIGFNYDPKVEYYAKELDIPLIEDIYHIHADKVMEIIKNIECNRKTIISKTNKRVSELKIDAKQNRENLKKLFSIREEKNEL